MPATTSIRPTPPPKLLYTLVEVAQATGIGRTQLYAFMKSGRLPYVMAGDRRYVRARDLEAFIDSLAAA
jgi:excisionase family DNA binding protein